MIDSHTHIYGKEFAADHDAVVERAQRAGVTNMVTPGEDAVTASQVIALRDAYPSYVSIALGLHPENVTAQFTAQLQPLLPLIKESGCVAIGEIGMDLYWDATMRDVQMQALEAQLQWCVQLGLPFIIHCRKALDECLEVIDGINGPLRGVFHSFTGTARDVERVRQRGDFYFGVNGIVTFKKSNVPALLPVIGLDRLLLETDAPYLAPVPHRGKRNESSYLPLVCDCVAMHLGMSSQEVDAATTRNAKALFGI